MISLKSRDVSEKPANATRQAEAFDNVLTYSAVEDEEGLTLSSLAAWR